MAFNNTAFRLASLACMFLCIVNQSNGDGVYNVINYGAKADGTTDNTFAFLDAWMAACQSNRSASVLIPNGTFLVGAIIFRDPPSNISMTFEIKGNLVAPSNPERVKTIGWIEFRSINDLTIGGGGTLDGQGAESWKDVQTPGKLPLTLRIIKCNNSRISNLNLINSKGFHMGIDRSEFVSVSDLTITAPDDSPNTDGIHVGYTSNLNISNIIIGTGDDCVSIGPGSTNISVTGVFCGPGHGISVGSLGKYEDEPDVKGVTVWNCTFNNTLNGVRIKTFQGSQPSVASDISFQDIVMNNVTHPILIDQEYCKSIKCKEQAVAEGIRTIQPPSMVEISNVIFKEIRGTSFRAEGVSIVCSKSVPCKNVQIQNVNLTSIVDGVGKAIDSVCSNNVMGGLLGQFKDNLCS